MIGKVLIAADGSENRMAFRITGVSENVPDNSHLTEIHLNSDLNGEFEANGNKSYVFIFFVISVVILLIACINFMNLSAANSSLRSKEVGMRKVVGSGRASLIGQFLGESVLLSYISLAVGMVAVWLLLPLFSNLIGRHLELHYSSGQRL